MAISANDLIMAGIGFLLIGILTPIGMQYIVNTGAWGNTSSWNAAVVTVFQVLLPILYIIGAALYFIPKARGK